MLSQQEVLAYLKLIGLGDKLADRVAEELTYEKVVDLVKNDPYSLMKVDGISFQKADKIARNYYSCDLNDKRRQKALIYHLLDGQKNLGHTFLPLLKLEKAMEKENITDFSLLEEAAQSGDLILEENRVYTRKMFEAEVGCAMLFRARIKE
jgi:hypothetical protein